MPKLVMFGLRWPIHAVAQLPNCASKHIGSLPGEPGLSAKQVQPLVPARSCVGALSGLGLILQDIGDDKQALEVYRRALAVYPRLQRIPDMVKTLQEKVEGRDI